MSTATLLLAHGSGDPRWRAPFERLAADLAEQLGPRRVYLAYLEHCLPDLPTRAAEAVADGHTRLRVVPMLMAAGGHMRGDVPGLIERLRARHPGADFELLPPLGEHPRFQALLRQVIPELAAEE